MPQEFLNNILTLGFIVLVTLTSCAAYQLILTLKSLRRLIDDVEDTTKDVNLIKDKIKLGALTGIATILGMVVKKRR